MQNTIKKFRQSSIDLENSDTLFENLKALTNSNYPTLQCILLELLTRWLLSNLYKRVCGVLGLQLFAKIKKELGFYKLDFYTFINNLIYKKIKNYHTCFCRHY